MDYGKFKQGTIIHGLRSEQYPDAPCSAVIITAECDIAQCKVSKFYYLTAMDVRTWMTTEGAAYARDSKQLTQLKKFIEDFSDKLPGPAEYRNAATIDLEDLEAGIRALPETGDTTAALETLSRITSIEPTNKDILGCLKQVFNGSLTQYFFIPRSAYIGKKKEDLKPEDFCEGLIVNFQDISYFDAATVSMIERQKMDFEKLSPTDRERYNHVFFLEDKDAIIFPEHAISSPYRERLMQAFSSAFIRIGVDFDSKAAKDYWDRALREPAQ